MNKAQINRDSNTAFTSNYLGTLFAFFDDCGIDRDLAASGTQLLELLIQPNRPVSLDQLQQVLTNTKDLLPIDPYMLGLSVGISFKMSSHGIIGFATASCDSIEDAIETSLSFTELYSSLVQFKYHRTQDSAIIEFSLKESTSEECRDFIVGLTLATLRSSALYLIGERLFKHLDHSIVELDFRPNTSKSYKRLSSGPLSFRFNQPKSRIIFSKSLAEEALPLANKMTKESLLASCESIAENNKKLDENYKESYKQKTLELLEECEEKFYTIEEIAKRLCVSSRTLHRQLQLQETSYSKLLAETRMKKAKSLLESSGLNITQIAYQLDYSDVSNFSTAFKNYFGVSPSKFLKKGTTIEPIALANNR